VKRESTHLKVRQPPSVTKVTSSTESASLEKVRRGCQQKPEPVVRWEGKHPADRMEAFQTITIKYAVFELEWYGKIKLSIRRKLKWLCQLNAEHPYSLSGTSPLFQKNKMSE
jgi:hypothetical protein